MENVSLVCLGRQVLYDRSLKSMDDALEYFKLSGQEFGFANLDELRKKHSESSSSDLKYVIELITGSETLAAQRYRDVLKINKDVTQLAGSVKNNMSRKSFFGMDAPRRKITYQPSPRDPFKAIDLNDLYEKWRICINVTDPEEHKLRRFVRHVLAEVVIDPSDIYRLTTRNRNTHDNLLNLPQDFRAALKGFILHVCGEDDPTSELAATIDNILSSITKENRRQPRKRGLMSDAPDSNSYENGVEDIHRLLGSAENSMDHSTNKSPESVRVCAEEEDVKMFDGKDSIPLLSQ